MDMKIRAAQAIAQSIDGPPRRDYIIPDSLDKDVALRISDEIGKGVKKSDKVL